MDRPPIDEGPMKKIASLIAAAAVLGACGQQKTPEQRIREALPAADSVLITQADPGSTAHLATTADGPTADGKAGLGVVSYLFALGVNGGVYVTLLRLELVTLLPPTSCQGDSCTWGPAPDAEGLNEWKLAVTKRSDGGYDYALSAAPVASGGTAFVDVIAGVAYAGADRWHGTGDLAVDFDRVAAGVAHPAGWTQTDFGTLSVHYDNRTTHVVDATFLDARNADHPGTDPANPNRINSADAFTSSGGAGDLQVAFHTLPPYSADNLDEQASLRTRWVEGGAGRADFQYANASGTFHESQCWAGQAQGFAMRYDDLATSPYGAETACAPTLQSADFATLTAP